MNETGFLAGETRLRLFDSHCHLDDDSFDEDRSQVLARAWDAGVEQILIPGVAASGWERLLGLCDQRPGLHAALGIHPMYIEGHGDADLTRLEGLLAAGRACALGECGLDYYIDQPDKPRQRELFAAQLDLAQQYRLAVVVHGRRAEEEAILMIRQRPGLRGVFHSFSGSYEQAKRLLELGFMLGVGGPLSYPRASRLRASVARLPLASLVLETDAPDQPDVDWRGRRNEPARLVRILQALTELRRESPEVIAEASYANAMELFAPGAG